MGARSEILAQLIAESCDAVALAAQGQKQQQREEDDDEFYEEEEEEEAPIVKLANLKPEIFEQILQFIYTNQCDLLVPGPCKIK